MGEIRTCRSFVLSRTEPRSHLCTAMSCSKCLSGNAFEPVLLHSRISIGGPYHVFSLDSSIQRTRAPVPLYMPCPHAYLAAECRTARVDSKSLGRVGMGLCGEEVESPGLLSHVKVGSHRLSIRDDDASRFVGMHESYRGYTLSELTHRAYWFGAR